MAGKKDAPEVKDALADVLADEVATFPEPAPPEGMYTSPLGAAYVLWADAATVYAEVLPAGEVVAQRREYGTADFLAHFEPAS